MAAGFVKAHSIMDTPHFSGDVVHGARNRNGAAEDLRKFRVGSRSLALTYQSPYRDVRQI